MLSFRCPSNTVTKSNQVSPYHSEMSEFRLSYSKAGAVVSAILVLLGVGLDWTLYPTYFEEFLQARIATAFLTLTILWILHNYDIGKRYVSQFTLLWLALPQIMIAIMIWRTDGVDSIYFVGLHLALYATGIILPIGFFEGIGFAFFTYILYFLACFLHPYGFSDFNRFLGISLFILFSGSVSAFCTYFNERRKGLVAKFETSSLYQKLCRCCTRT